MEPPKESQKVEVPKVCWDEKPHSGRVKILEGHRGMDGPNETTSNYIARVPDPAAHHRSTDIAGIPRSLQPGAAETTGPRTRDEAERIVAQQRRKDGHTEVTRSKSGRQVDQVMSRTSLSVSAGNEESTITQPGSRPSTGGQHWDKTHGT